MDHLDAATVEPPEQLLARLDRMVEAGRVTAAEADRVRTAGSDAERAAALNVIRFRHAKARLAKAVSDGQITQADADRALKDFEHGEGPGTVRRLLRRRDNPGD